MNAALIGNSMLIAASTTVGAVAIGFMSALGLSALPERGRQWGVGLAILALAMPPFIVTDGWLYWLGQTGAWRGWWPFSIYSLGGTVWILMLLTWPITLATVLAAWNRLEPAQLDMDPALRGWSLVRWLLWPTARGAVGQAVVLTFVLALNNFAVPAILQVKVLPAELWVGFNTTFNYSSALLLCWPMILAPLLLLLWFRNRELAWPRFTVRFPARRFCEQIGAGWLTMAGLVTGGVLLASVVMPLISLLGTRAVWTELPAGRATAGRAGWISLFFAAAGATICLALGCFGWRRSPISLCWLPFLAPGVLLGIALIFLLNRPPFIAFYQSAGLVVLGLALRYLALGWTAAFQACHSVDRDLVDAARLEGAAGWRLFRLAYWPQVAPRLAAVWYVTYLLCLWDVETLVLLVPPGGETLALRIFNLLHYGHNSQVNALCLMLLGLAVLPLAVWRGAQTLAGSRWRGISGRRMAWLALWMTGLGLGGCAPNPPANEAPIKSELFRQVRVIGTRGAGLGQFNKPRSVAVDAQDNLYVVDMTGRVQKFSPAGEFLSFWQMPQTDKGKPKGMGRNAAGQILVIEPHYARINQFTPEGKLTAQWGTSGTNTGQLAFPRAVAVNSHGEIYISEYGIVERVQQFTSNGNQCLNSFGRPGREPGQFNRPEGLGIDPQDRVCVADSCNHRIQIFARDGRFLSAYGRPGSGRGELSYPYDVQADAAGRQYVCEFGNSRIQVFNQRGESLEIIGGVGSAPGQFFNPWSVALDSAGNLYVADSGNHRVQKFIRKEP